MQNVAYALPGARQHRQHDGLSNQPALLNTHGRTEHVKIKLAFVVVYDIETCAPEDVDSLHARLETKGLDDVSPQDTKKTKIGSRSAFLTLACGS